MLNLVERLSIIDDGINLGGKSFMKSIQARLVTLICTILFLTLATVSTLTYVQVQQQVEENVQIEGAAVVGEKSEQIELYLQNYSASIDRYSRDSRVANLLQAAAEDKQQAWQEINEDFQIFNGLNEHIAVTYIGSYEGDFYTEPFIDVGSDYDPRTRPWYEQASSSPDQIIWTEPYEDASTGEYVVTVAKAVTGSGNTVLGVVSLDLNLENLTNIVRATNINYNGFFFLFDDTGVALVHPELTGNHSEHPVISQMLNQAETGFIEYDSEGNDRILYYDTIDSTNWRIGAVFEHENMMADANNIRNMIMLTALIAIMLAGIIAYIVSRRITRPIVALQNQVSRVADGDLTVTIKSKSKDEIGALTADFNRMVASVKELVHSIQSSVNQVNHSAESLSAISEETIASSEEVANAINEIASGSTKQVEDIDETKQVTFALSDQIEKVNHHSSDLVDLSNKAKSENEKGSEQVTLLREKTHAFNNVIQRVENVVQTLSGRVKEVEQVINTINDISEQTNLLALNASIEAARAGESGKGFAVVADEVRKLAEQTSQATSKVRQTIEGIESETNKVVDEVSATKSITIEQNNAVRESEQSFQEIATVVDQINQSIESIKHEMKLMTDRKNTVVSSIERVAGVSEQSAAAAEEVTASTEEQLRALATVADSAELLNNASQELTERMKQFKI